MSLCCSESGVFCDFAYARFLSTLCFRPRTHTVVVSDAYWRALARPRVAPSARGTRTAGRSEATTEDRRRLGRCEVAGLCGCGFSSASAEASFLDTVIPDVISVKVASAEATE